MSSLREKLEKVHALLINEERSQAEALFHEAFVEAAREIHKQIMEEEDWLEDDEDKVDEAEDEGEADADSEAEMGDEEGEAEADSEAEMGDEEGEAEADLEAEMGDEEGEESEEGDVEDRIADLEAELEALRAEFETLQADEMGEPEHDDIYGGEEGEEGEKGEEDLMPDEMDAEEEPVDEDLQSDKAAGAEKYGHIPGYDTSLTPSHPKNYMVVMRHRKSNPTVIKTNEVDALDESFELESVATSMGEKGVGTGKGFEPSVNKSSPIPQKKVGDRMGGKAVDPTKGKEHKGYDREANPAVQQMEKRKNVLSRSDEKLSKVTKEGDKSAAINKTESEFGKGNVTSPIGSKGTVQAKSLTESRKRKA